MWAWAVVIVGGVVGGCGGDAGVGVGEDAGEGRGGDAGVG